MSKAVLVLDEMPECCVKCRLSIYNGEVRCTAVHKHAKPIDDIRTKPDWCPLREVVEG